LSCKDEDKIISMVAAPSGWFAKYCYKDEISYDEIAVWCLVETTFEDGFKMRRVVGYQAAGGKSLDSIEDLGGEFLGYFFEPDQD